MENSVPMASRGFSALHTTAYLRYIASIRCRLNAYGREAELETGYIMGRPVNNITLRGGLGSILEGGSDVYNFDTEVLCCHDGNNQMEFRFY